MITRSRSDALVVVFFVVAITAVLISATIFGAASSAAVQVTLVAASLTFLYAVYWSFNIRRALFVRIYRYQALGVGLVALVLVLFNVLGLIVPFPLRFVITQFTLMFWVDRSVLTARRSDPLLRDTFHWKRGLRFLPWALMVFSFAVLSIENEPVPRDILNFASFLMFNFVPYVSGAIILPIVAWRSKDTRLRKHFEWFGLFALFTILSFFVGGFFPELTGTFFPETLTAQLIVTVLSLVPGFCLYRSAKSLVPLNQLSLEAETVKGDF